MISRIATSTCRIAIRLRPLWVLVFVGAGYCFPIGRLEEVFQEDSFRDYFPQLKSADWDAISQGCPIEHEENETLTQILNATNNIPEKFWKMAADSNTATLTDAMAFPAENVGKVFSLSGTCVQVHPPWNLENDGTSGMVETGDNQMNGQRILIACDDGLNAQVMAQSLPGPARDSNPNQNRSFIGQPVECLGMFLFADDDGPVLVTRNVHWKPKTVSSELNIGKDKLELVRAGLDLELLDMAHNYTDMALVSEEKELFDQMLAATQFLSEDPGNVRYEQGKPFDLIELVEHPSQNAGSLIQVQGTLRRYTSVVIDDPELRKAVGNDQYYQLDVFVPLGNKRIQMGSDGQNKPTEISGEYGITVIVSRLPDAILTSRLPIRIQVPAFMLKVWEQTTLATSRASNRLRRPSPVLIGISSQLHPVPPSASAASLFILIPSIGFGILGILGILFFLTRNRVQKNHGRPGVVKDPDFAVLFNDEQDESP